MKRLIMEATELAKELERDIYDLVSHTTRSTGSVPPTKSVDQHFERIERKIDDLQSQIILCLERLPKDLPKEFLEFKKSFPSSSKKAADDNFRSSVSRPERKRIDASSLSEIANNLTPQEKKIFRLCLQSGPQTYREIARYLSVAPTTVKNVVNLVFRDINKRILFEKGLEKKIVKLRIAPEVEKEILKGTQKWAARI